MSLVSENVEKVIKLETDMLDDCMWESRIEITKDVSNQNNVELPLECQVISFLNMLFLLYLVYHLFTQDICYLGTKLYLEYYIYCIIFNLHFMH